MTVNKPDPSRSEYSYGQNYLPSDNKKNPLKAAINKFQRGAESIKNKIRSATDKSVGKNLSSTFNKALKKDDYVIDDSRPNPTLHQKFQKLAKPISEALSKAKHSSNRDVTQAATNLHNEVRKISSEINNNASVNADRRIQEVQRSLDELNKLLRTDNQD